MGYTMQRSAISRLHRIKGQVGAIENMYLDGKYSCIDMVTQIQAAREGLSKVAQLLLSDEAKRCIDKGDLKVLEKVVRNAFKTI